MVRSVKKLSAFVVMAMTLGWAAPVLAQELPPGPLADFIHYQRQRALKANGQPDEDSAIPSIATDSGIANTPIHSTPMDCESTPSALMPEPENAPVPTSPAVPVTTDIEIQPLSVTAQSVTFSYTSATNGQTSTNGSYSWTTPNHTIPGSVTATVWGAGGGGGGATARGYSGLGSYVGAAAGGGGGSGCANSGSLGIGTHTVKVGAGGNGGISTLSCGSGDDWTTKTSSNGGSSSVGSISAGGGSGAPDAITYSGGLCSEGGRASSGGAGCASGGTSGGAGSMSNMSFGCNPPTNIVGGNGGNGGAGANIGSSNIGTAGAAGGVGGGGGGGAARSTNNSCNSGRGGKGGDGQITISYQIFNVDTMISSITAITGPFAGSNQGFTDGGDTVYIDITNFSQINCSQPIEVLFGSTPATNVSCNAANSRLIVTNPTHTAGAVAVTVKFTDSVYGFTDWAITKASAFAYVTPFISIAASANSIKLSITPTPSGAQATDGTNITVSTNLSGYTLQMRADPPDMSCAANPAFTLNAQEAPGALQLNRWAYTLDPGLAAWQPPTVADTTIRTSGQALSGETTPVYFGAKADLMQPPCDSYQTTVTFTATGL